MFRSIYTFGVGVALIAWPFPASAYQTATVADGGTIQGKVVFNGPVPKRMIIPTKDQEVCGNPREEPEILVGPGNGVREAIVYLEGIATGKPWPTAEKAPELDNRQCRFQPHVQVIQPGKITVVNSDPMLHNTKAFYGRRTAFNIALPNKDQRIDAELPRTGTVRIECDAHGWMRGWVHVAETPYYAVTGEDGTFSIADVPPGNYTLVVNQPAVPPMQIPVTVKPKETSQVAVELKK
ncbi:MAG TPA: carboxypeptidase regulatory-like domain-containing protein [Azospirillum sp.]|nr:carboxypeptidase regulatory-like domain-containing protein [Azospirillum sp.]